MRHNSSLILIENPLTGNASVSKSLKLSDVEKVGRWATPDEGREALGESKWKSAKKIILVRDTVARFQSGASLALNSSSDTLRSHGASDEFADKALSLAEEAPNARARFDQFVKLVASTLNSGGGWEALPTYLHPQSRWLTAKIDVVLATHDIAQYFTQVVKKSCVRSNQSFNSPSFPYHIAPASSSHAGVLALYAEDVAVLDKLPVWSPVEGQIRFVSGWCASCNKTKNKDGDVEPDNKSDDSSVPAQTAEDKTAAPAKKSKRKTTRHRRKPKS